MRYIKTFEARKSIHSLNKTKTLKINDKIDISSLDPNDIIDKIEIYSPGIYNIDDYIKLYPNINSVDVTNLDQNYDSNTAVEISGTFDELFLEFKGNIKLNCSIKKLHYYLGTINYKPKKLVFGSKFKSKLIRISYWLLDNMDFDKEYYEYLIDNCDILEVDNKIIKNSDKDYEYLVSCIEQIQTDYKLGYNLTTASLTSKSAANILYKGLQLDIILPDHNIKTVYDVLDILQTFDLNITVSGDMLHIRMNKD